MATYYVSTDDGNDSYNGLYPTYQGGSNGPWLTWSKAKGGSYSAGDTICFKRGNTWNICPTSDTGYTWWWPASGSSGSPITITAYGTGNKPIINAFFDLKGSSGDWTDLGSNIWRRSISCTDSYIKRCFIDGAGFNDKESAQPSVYTGINGTKYLWLFDYDNQYFYVYSTSNPATNYNYIRAAKERAVMGTYFGRSYWTVSGLEFRGGLPFYINGSTADSTYITIDNCRFYRPAKYGLYAHIETSGRNNDHFTISYNEFDFDHNLVSGTTPLSESEFQDISYEMLSFTNGLTNSTISHNTFIDSAHGGIGFMALESGHGGINGNVIEHNEFYRSSCPFCRAVGMAGLEDKCRGNVFRYNYIENQSAECAFNGQYTEVYYNVFFSSDSCSWYGYEESQAIHIYAGSGQSTHHVKVYNNVIKDNYAEGLLLYQLDSVSPTYCEIKNNIFINNGTGHIDWHNFDNIQIVIGSGTSTTNVIDRNVFYDSDTSEVIAYKNEATAHTVSWADSNTDEFVSNLGSNPKIGSDFKIASDSPCRDAGTDVGLHTDYFNQYVPSGSAPDIGAHEYHDMDYIRLRWSK